MQVKKYKYIYLIVVITILRETGLLHINSYEARHSHYTDMGSITTGIFANRNVNLIIDLKSEKIGTYDKSKNNICFKFVSDDIRNIWLGYIPLNKVIEIKSKFLCIANGRVLGEIEIGDKMRVKGICSRYYAMNMIRRNQVNRLFKYFDNLKNLQLSNPCIWKNGYYLHLGLYQEKNIKDEFDMRSIYSTDVRGDFWKDTIILNGNLNEVEVKKRAKYEIIEYNASKKLITLNRYYGNWQKSLESYFQIKPEFLIPAKESNFDMEYLKMNRPDATGTWRRFTYDGKEYWKEKYDD